MYTVEADGVVIYDDTSLLDDTILIDPVLTMADNNAGSFETTIPPNNRGYSSIAKMLSTITIKKDGQWVFAGRVIDDIYDFRNNRKINCEGVLAFLNDSSLLDTDYSSNTISNFLTKILNKHNAQVSASRRIYLGAVTVKDIDQQGISEAVANYETPLEFIKNRLTDIYGGHIRIRFANNKYYLDYYEDFPNTSTQTIDFGVNLIDFTKNWNIGDICSVCIPKGKQLDSDGTNNTKYLTCASANNNSPYIVNNNLVRTYGRIEKTIDFGDVDSPSVLKKLGEAYLNTIQYDGLSLSVNAVDLHMLNPAIQSFELLDRVRCLSLPHSMDIYLPITQVSIPLDAPQSIQYNLGNVIDTTLSSAQSANVSKTNALLDAMPTRESLLEEAFRNSNEILTAKTTGYVNIIQQDEHSQALIISDKIPYNTASRYWQFNMNGLGYFVRQSNGSYQNKGIAITMDGQINASMITTGQMNADRILAGSITVTQIGNNAVTSAKLANGSVSTAKIIDGNLTTAKLANSAITTVKIADGAIVAGKIAANAITAGKIAANAITADKIQSGAISSDKIQANAITAGKIAANAITAEKIAANAITAEKIAANAITADEIRAGTITADEIRSGSITGGNGGCLANNTITDYNIKSLNADKITAGSISGDYIKGGTIEGTIFKTNGYYGTITLTNGDMSFGGNSEIWGDRTEIVIRSNRLNLGYCSDIVFSSLNDINWGTGVFGGTITYVYDYTITDGYVTSLSTSTMRFTNGVLTYA